MFAQLGNIIFQSVFGFESYEIKGTVNYAQHELINAKPVLQPTGANLDELSVQMNLRSNFINVTAAILSLRNSRDNYEILPLVKGNGQYVGDFVITEIIENETQALDDGTVVAATVTVELLEYAIADKLQQQQAAARKQAFATGNTDPFAINIQQQPTLPQLAAGDLSAVNSQAALVDREVSQYENNVSRRESIAGHIQKALNKMDKSLQDFNERLDEITILDDVASILSSVAVVRQYIQNFQFPITSIPDLQANNRDLQNVVRNLGGATTELINLVITRAA